MELELRLHPEDAGRLPRLRCIAPALRGRARVQQQRPVWHDSPDRALAAAGLVLVQERGTWRLERLIPGGAAWLPGAPPPVVERATELSAFDHALPTPLAPVASFDGRLASYVLETEDGTVALGLLRGTLRTVADEQPAGRVLLAGAELPLRRLAVAIAEELRLDIPATCLAAEGFALAHGLPPAARQHGAPVLPPDLPLGDAFARAVGHLTDVILHFGRRRPGPACRPGGSAPDAGRGASVALLLCSVPSRGAVRPGSGGGRRSEVAGNAARLRRAIGTCSSPRPPPSCWRRCPMTRGCTGCFVPLTGAARPATPNCERFWSARHSAGWESNWPGSPGRDLGARRWIRRNC